MHASSDDVAASGRTLGCTGKAAAAADAVEKREEGDADATVTAGENMVVSKRPAVVDGPTCLPSLARRAIRVTIPSRRAACAEDSRVYGTATAVMPLKSHTITFDLLLLRHERGGETLSASAALAESAADAAGTKVQSVRCEPPCSMFARLGGAARCLHDWVKLGIFNKN